MSSSPNVSPELRAQAEAQVRSGRYPSLDQALAAIMRAEGAISQQARPTRPTGAPTSGRQGMPLERGGVVNPEASYRNPPLRAAGSGGDAPHGTGQAPIATAQGGPRGVTPPAQAPQAPPARSQAGVEGDPGPEKWGVFTPGAGVKDPAEVKYRQNTNQAGVQSNGDDDPWLIGAFDGGTYDPQVMQRWVERARQGDGSARWVLEQVGYQPGMDPQEWAGSRNLTTRDEAFGAGGKWYTAPKATPQAPQASQGGASLRPMAGSGTVAADQGEFRQVDFGDSRPGDKDWPGSVSYTDEGRDKFGGLSARPAPEDAEGWYRQPQDSPLQLSGRGPLPRGHEPSPEPAGGTFGEPAPYTDQDTGAPVSAAQNEGYWQGRRGNTRQGQVAPAPEPLRKPDEDEFEAWFR